MFDRGLTQLLHPELHWLDIPQCVQYKLGESQFTGVCRTRFLNTWWDCAACVHLTTRADNPLDRPTVTYQLMVPRHRRSTFGRRAFSTAGPMKWNSLPDSLRDPARSTDGFRSALKSWPALQSTFSRTENIVIDWLIDWLRPHGPHRSAPPRAATGSEVCKGRSPSQN